MPAPPGNDDRLNREVAYYKRNLDEVAAENVRLDAALSAMRHEVRQKRHGFHLLAELQESIAEHAPVSVLFRLTASAINASLGMDRTILLTPAERPGWFRPMHWAGFGEEAASGLAALSIEVPPDVAKGKGVLIATSATEHTTDADAFVEHFEVPYFVCVPVADDTTVIGLLFSGRLHENALVHPVLGPADVNSLKAIAGLVASAVLQERVAALQEADRLKTAFFSSVSHEFRTPITLSLGPLEEILAGRRGPVPDDVLASLRLVHRNQERLRGLIDQILELARLEDGVAHLRVSAVRDVNRFVEDHVRPFRAVAEMRGLNLWVSLDPTLVGTDLYLDREQFETLLTNLLSNALKFTQEGSVKVATALADDMFTLVVADTGVGIHDDELPYVFDRFHRAAGAQGGGSGIGLALVKEIAARHGGDVTVHSQLGVGSTFRVGFPFGTSALDPRAVLDLTEEQPAQPNIEHAVLVSETTDDARDVELINQLAEANFDPAKPVVLYAEDHREMRTYVRDLLTADCNVFVASDGLDALFRAKRYQPDVIVSDEMMPRLTGGELLKALRKDAELSSTPVMLLTAKTATDARIQSLEAGADDYLTKPFHAPELRARIRNLVRGRAQEKDLTELTRRLESTVEHQMAELVRTGDLKRFVSPAVVAALLAGDLGNTGGFERRLVTVLFAATVGFADLADRLEPEDLSSVLNQYLADMTAVAIADGGTVDSLDGDRLMVIFGAPDPSEDTVHASAAVRAAVAMRAVAANLAAGLRRRGVATDLRLRMGLNTGFCTVGVFGGPSLSTYTALGPPVNVAAKLQERAGPGVILCGSPTYRLTRDTITAKRSTGPTMSDAPSGFEVYEIFGMVARVEEATSQDPGSASDEPPEEEHDRLFRKTGDYWTIGYAGEVSRVKDSLGVGYLAQLLGQPGGEVHVFTLAGTRTEGRSAAPARRSGARPTDVELTSDALGDAGAMLDSTAKRAYKRRLDDLHQEAEEARDFNDFERATRVDEEIEALVQALAAAVGLGGRDRKAAASTERARLNVTRAIKSAIGRIADHNPALGRHLAVTVSTGTYCSYTPDPSRPVTWTL